MRLRGWLLALLILFGSLKLFIGLFFEGDFSEEHKKCLESYEWHIKAMENEKTIQTNNYSPETLQMYNQTGLDLEEFMNRE